VRFLYWVYALRLRRQVSSHAVPRHIGIILDGNRRYARKHHLAHSRVAYDLGAEKLDDVLAWCLDLGIPAVTVVKKRPRDPARMQLRAMAIARCVLPVPVETATWRRDSGE
jgi:undecaprenyl pyrophosphate synthase